YMREDVVLGSKAMTNVRRLVETGEVAQIPWAGDFFSMEEERVSAQLAFVGAIDVDEYTVVLVAPFTQVFAQRGETMMWVSLVAFALLATLYVVVSRVLECVVAKPIDGMDGHV
ncbi:MAG: hypothetical protein UHS51_05190, partial [Atopobiaceae bacterium]|nr:hypothetical protein [Atopobiaceae bacterium]